MLICFFIFSFVASSMGIPTSVPLSLLHCVVLFLILEFVDGAAGVFFAQHGNRRPAYPVCFVDQSQAQTLEFGGCRREPFVRAILVVCFLLSFLFSVFVSGMQGGLERHLRLFDVCTHDATELGVFLFYLEIRSTECAFSFPVCLGLSVNCPKKKQRERRWDGCNPIHHTCLFLLVSAELASTLHFCRQVRGRRIFRVGGRGASIVFRVCCIDVFAHASRVRE